MSPEPLDSDLLEMEAELSRFRPVDPDFLLFQSLTRKMEPALSVVPSLSPSGMSQAYQSHGLNASNGAPTHGWSHQVPITSDSSRKWKPVAVAAAACAVGAVGFSSGILIKDKYALSGGQSVALPMSLASGTPRARIESMQIPADFVYIGSFSQKDQPTQTGRAGTIDAGNGQMNLLPPSGWIKEIRVFENPKTGERINIEHQRPMRQ